MDLLNLIFLAFGIFTVCLLVAFACIATVMFKTMFEPDRIFPLTNWAVWRSRVYREIETGNTLTRILKLSLLVCFVSFVLAIIMLLSISRLGD